MNALSAHHLVALWNAAHVRVVLNGDWRSTIGRLDYAEYGDLLFGYQVDEKCGLRTDFHPWPSPQSPLIQELAERGSFRVCAVIGQSFWPIGLDTTGPMPTGEIAEYTEAVVLQMGEAVGRNVTLEWVYGVDSTECFNKVDTGEADMYGPVSGLGDANWKESEILRAFEPSCAYFEQNDMYAVRRANNWTTFMDMHSAARRIIQDGQTPEVVTGGWIGDTYLHVERELWPEGTEVLDATPLTQETMLTGLKAGDFLGVRAARIPGAFVGNPRENSLAENDLRLIHGQIATKNVAVFRRQPVTSTSNETHERHDLVTAWNAAQRALLFDGSWRDLVGESGVDDLWGYHYDVTCGSTSPGPEDWPIEPFSKSLHGVLARRNLRVAFRSNRGGTQVNTRTDPPSGTFVEYTKRLVARMGLGLGLGENDLQVEFVLRDTHLECWEAVLNGEADAYGPNVDLGTASFDGAAAVQRLEPSCSLYESNDMYGIMPGSNMFTFQDMHARAREMIANGTTPSIFIGGPFDWWPDVEPWLWPEGTNVVDAITGYPDSAERSQVALDGLVNGTWLAIRLALLPGIWSGPPPRQVVRDLGVQAVMGQLSAGKATYFVRQDDAQPSCGSICLGCNDADKCSSCAPNAKLDDTTGQCQCETGFLEAMFACVRDENINPDNAQPTPQPVVAAPPTPPTQSKGALTSSDSDDTGRNVGIAVGVVAGVVLLAVAFVLVKRARAGAAKEDETPEFKEPPSDAEA